MPKIEAPFTEEQVAKLKQWQSGEKTFTVAIGELKSSPTIQVPPHPFTCCSYDGCERGAREDQGILVPSTNGWTCPCGKYTQDWCHDFMVE